jgi:hypothetical protein
MFYGISTNSLIFKASPGDEIEGRCLKYKECKKNNADLTEFLEKLFERWPYIFWFQSTLLYNCLYNRQSQLRQMQSMQKPR